MIKEFEEAHSLDDVKSVKKLKGNHSYFRKRMGDYRIGFGIENDEIVLYRFLHRKDMYRYFP